MMEVREGGGASVRDVKEEGLLKEGMSVRHTTLVVPDFLLLLVTEQVMDQSTVHSTEHSFYHWLGT